MEIIGRIIVALDEVSGVSKSSGSTWKKREYVLETQETYPKKIFFDFFGERADLYPLQVGQEIKLTFDIESREYQGRWFTSIRGRKAEPITAGAAVPTPGAFPGAVPPPPAYGTPAHGATAYTPGAVPPPPMPENGPSDDLPF